MIKVRVIDKTEVEKRGHLMGHLEMKTVKGRIISFQSPAPTISLEITRRQCGAKNVR